MGRFNNKSGAGKGSNKTSMPLAQKSVYIDQSAVVYDLISEGEIEGLVNGAHSIYLNGAPVLDGQRKDTYAAKTTGNASYVASTGTITDNQSSNVFSNLTVNDGTRYIKVYGGAAQGNSNVVAN